jgi:hypothetical protein
VAGAGVVGKVAVVRGVGELGCLALVARLPLEAAVYGYESCSANGT